MILLVVLPPPSLLVLFVVVVSPPRGFAPPSRIAVEYHPSQSRRADARCLPASGPHNWFCPNSQLRGEIGLPIYSTEEVRSPLTHCSRSLARSLVSSQPTSSSPFSCFAQSHQVLFFLLFLLFPHLPRFVGHRAAAAAPPSSSMYFCQRPRSVHCRWAPKSDIVVSRVA